MKNFLSYLFFAFTLAATSFGGQNNFEQDDLVNQFVKGVSEKFVETEEELKALQAKYVNLKTEYENLQIKYKNLLNDYDIEVRKINEIEVKTKILYSQVKGTSIDAENSINKYK